MSLGLASSLSNSLQNSTDTPTFDYLEFQYDSALQQFLEKEDLVSLHLSLCSLEVTLPALKIITLEELNQLCDKLSLDIGSATRLQFTRAIVKLQDEYKQKRRERRERERQQRELRLDIQHSTLNDKKSRSSSLRSKSPPRLKAFANSSPLRPILSLGGNGHKDKSPAFSTSKSNPNSKGLSPAMRPVMHSTPITPLKPKHDPKPISLSASESYTRPLSKPKPRGYDYSIKCILLGDSAVGKSCILVRYFDDSFQCSAGATIGIDYRIKTVELGDDVIKFQIWDTAGQEKYRTIIAAYYRGIDAALICYDITNRESFENLMEWIENVQEYSSEDAFMMLVGTKLDLVDPKEGGDASLRQVTKHDGMELAEMYKLKFCETSSKNGHGVDSLFVTTASYCVMKQKQAQQAMELRRRETQERVEMIKAEELSAVDEEPAELNKNKFVKKKCCNVYI